MTLAIRFRALRCLLSIVALCSAASAAQAQSLTVYGAMGYDEAVVHAFTQATGIAVKLVHLSTGPLLARVQAEGSRPQWDVLWFDGNMGMRVIASRHLLDCGWTPAVDYTAQGEALLPADRCYLPVGMTYADALLVNTARLAPAARPQSWGDLERPALRGRVGMNNPAISGPAFPMVAGVLQAMGDTAGQSYFSRLKANGLRVYPTNSVTLRALQFGQIDVAVVQSSAAVGFASKNPALRVVLPQPATALPSNLAIGVHAVGANRDAARRFVAFVLSPAGQAALQQGDAEADSNYMPLVAGVKPTAAAAALPAVQVQRLDPTQWGPREAAVDAWFTAHVVR
ncbi:MAG: extracellular solute-binding protein [Burkholderiales bacterium]|nr:extracellular solute-binding protein [Burkholderiales bacterium]